MKRAKTVSIRRLEEIYRPIYKKLYFMAYAVTGNDRMAEQALVRAMLDTGSATPEYLTQKHARELCREETAEMNFDCLPDGEDGLGEYLSFLDENERRIIMLRFGMDMSVYEIAEVTNVSGGKIRKILSDALREAEQLHKNSAEKALCAACRREMASCELAPDLGTILRAAENQLGDEETPRSHARMIRGTLNWLATVMILVLLGIMLWGCAILIDYFRQTGIQTSAAQKTSAVIAVEDDHARI